MRRTYQRVASTEDLAQLVAKVEEADGKTTEDDGEVHPGKVRSFVCEEDLKPDITREAESQSIVSKGGGVKAWGRVSPQARFIPRLAKEV
jgi:hypothetical protein